VGNNAAAARARRKLAKSGGKNLTALCIHDFEGWCAVLREEGYLSKAPEPETLCRSNEQPRIGSKISAEPIGGALATSSFT